MLSVSSVSPSSEEAEVGVGRSRVMLGVRGTWSILRGEYIDDRLGVVDSEMGGDLSLGGMDALDKPVGPTGALLDFCGRGASIGSSGVTGDGSVGAPVAESAR